MGKEESTPGHSAQPALGESTQPTPDESTQTHLDATVSFLLCSKDFYQEMRPIIFAC